MSHPSFLLQLSSFSYKHQACHSLLYGTQWQLSPTLDCDMVLRLHGRVRGVIITPAFRLVRYVGGLASITRTLWLSLPSLVSIVALLAISTFIYASALLPLCTALHPCMFVFTMAVSWTPSPILERSHASGCASHSACTAKEPGWHRTFLILQPHLCAACCLLQLEDSRLPGRGSRVCRHWHAALSEREVGHEPDTPGQLHKLHTQLPPAAADHDRHASWTFSTCWPGVDAEACCVEHVVVPSHHQLRVEVNT